MYLNLLSITMIKHDGPKATWEKKGFIYWAYTPTPQSIMKASQSRHSRLETGGRN